MEGDGGCHKIIMNLRKNKNKDIQTAYPESERCDDCGVDNVWDLSFSAFVDHLDEHKGRESHTRGGKNYPSS